MTAPVARHRSATQPPQRGGRRVAPRTKPRYGRLAAFGSAAFITTVSIGAGIGLIPSEHDAAYAATRHPDTAVVKAAVTGVTGEGVGAAGQVSGQLDKQDRPATSALPEGSGTGKRVVFDQSDQRVWLVDASGVVTRTYLVSGSVTDNLQPGTYSVYSKSRWAVGISDSGVMQYMVRFTQGDNAAIGFHSIPTKNGVPLQTKALLGTPQSHGCIRQKLPDAVALWNFAPEGTTVVVTA
jgi:lipoprotein-anchoring transpeptidase ErfK/SrfK